MQKTQNKLRAIAPALGVCTACEHRILAIDLAEDSSDAKTAESESESRASSLSPPPDTPIPFEWPTNDITYLRASLSGVRSVDSDLQAFTIKNCELENVTFKFCKFSKVIFQDLKLKNVSFHNVDFRNVRLQDAELENVAWSTEGVAHALVTGACFRKTTFGRTILTLRTTECTKLSKTVGIRPPPLPAGRVDESIDFGVSSIVIVQREVELFQLPQSVLQKIVSEVFPRPDTRDEKRVVMVDRQISNLETPTTQTRYAIKNPFGYRVPLSTYRGWLNTSPPPDEESAKNSHSYTALLLVNKRCWQISIRALYDRVFHFSSPESCLALLHDHQSSVYAIAGLSLFFSSQTNPAAWKRLFDVIVSERQEIKEIRLSISAEFWNTTQWMYQATPQQVAESCYMTAWPFGGRTFLQHVMRIQGFRLSGTGKPATKAENVRLLLCIEGTKGYPSREAFVDELEMFMRQEMLRNVAMGNVVRRECCEIKQLEESCYWKRTSDDH